MDKRNKTIQRIKEEEEDSYSDDSLFQISSFGADLSFRELISRYKDDELVKPELQRKYVWDRAEAARFIDSLLLGLPVPSIFLAKTQDERLLIVDGFQRIMTVYDYVDGIFSKDGKVFRLSRSAKINERWRGKAFAELSEVEQRRVRNTTIHAIIFEQKEPENDDTSLFQVFERINTSGRTLLPQEIRNCVAQGTFNRLLFELNEIPAWRKLFGMEESDPRMRDMEYILRFFALSSDDFLKDKRERISLKRFLDLYMKNNANLPQESLDRLRLQFSKSIQLVYEMFGDTAFHNISPSDPNKLVKKFSPTLFDSICIATSYSISAGKRSFNLESIEDMRRHLLSKERYKFAISKETMTRANIITRIDMACECLFGMRYAQ